MINDAFDALNALDPNMPRESWVRVAFAAKDAGITEDEFVAWSEGAGNFDRQDAISTYRNAKPRAGGVTAATLFMMARDAGYKPEARRPGNGEARPPATVERKPAAATAVQRVPVDATPIWDACQEAASHGYLTRKRIAAHGARVNSAGWLVVPYRDRDGALQTVQLIAADGTKRFLAGARVKGSVAYLGSPKSAAVVVIAEGFATAAAIEETTGYPVLAAGSRVTLPEAARIARHLAPDARVIVAADRGDLSTPLAAARAVGGFLALPGPEDSADGFDFADWRLSGTGDAEIKARIDRAAVVDPAEPEARDVAGKAVAKAKATSAGDLGPYFLDSKGRILPNLANLATYLESGAAGDLRRDVFTGITTWRGAPLGESSYVQLTRELQGATIDGRRPFLKVAVSMVADALSGAVEAHPFNSCVDWLDALPAWDGTERIERFFVDSCDAPDDDYSRGVGRYFWLGMVSRMVEPGFQVDSSVALIGPQGIGKSSLARIIGGERYAEVGLVGIGERDWIAQLRGQIVIELSELSGHSRAELETIKAILSRRFDLYRAAYARLATVVPRGNVFVATTNETEFLIDASGNRRWLPVVCKSAIALDNVSAMRPAYFAEAYARVRAGLPRDWHAVPDAANVQARHVANDPWIDLLSEKLPSAFGDLPASVANTLIYETLKVPADRQSGAMGRRIAAVMRALGYRRDQWAIPGSTRRIRGYVRDPDSIDETIDGDRAKP